MKVLGWVAMAAAIVAIVIGLVAAVGVWVAKPGLEARVQDLLVSAADGLVRADELLDRTEASVAVASDAVARIDTLARSVAEDPVISEQTRTDLATSIESFITGPYADLQETYAGLAERVVAVSQALVMVDRLLPGVSLPGDVAQSLTSIDEAVTQLDATITGGAGLVTESLTGPSPAARVAERTQQVAATLTTVQGLIPGIDDRLSAAQTHVADAQAQLSTWANVLAVVVTLLGLYLAGLNVLLFQKGRQWAGRSGASAAG